jgi:hypothetical protein
VRFEEPTKWELFLDGFHDFWYAWDCYVSSDYREFWEALSSGWYDDYIYPYDDIFYGHIPSKERKLRLRQEPERIIVSAEAYDELVRRINEPQDPAVVERIKELMNRKAPWDDE